MSVAHRTSPEKTFAQREQRVRMCQVCVCVCAALVLIVARTHSVGSAEQRRDGLAESTKRRRRHWP